jgi:hypothetical protein
MSLSECFRCVLTASIAVELMSGCGGSQQPTGLPGTIALGAEGHKRVKHLAAPTTVYVADTYNDEIIEYPAGVSNPAPKGSFALPSEPLSLADDSSGNLYVGLTNPIGVNIYNSRGVLVGQLNGNNGVNCAAHGLTFDATGNLYVSQAPGNAPPCTAGSDVLEFTSPPTGQPSYIYQIPRGAQVVPNGLATDGQENLYVANIDDPVFKFPQHSQNYISTGLLPDLGVAILANNDLAVSYGSSVTIYAPQPSGGYQEVNQLTYGAGTEPELIATASDGTLYVPVIGANNQTNNGTVYAYPANGNPYIITNGLVERSGLGPIAAAAGK